MSKYAVLEDPRIDTLIDSHLGQILDAITNRVSPQSVILYGSVARGETSVMVERDGLRMLSDYEIKIVDRSPRLRSVCKELSHEMTDKLGVSTGIGWFHPARLEKNLAGNLSLRKEKPSIFLYELKSAGRTLYGRDLLRTGSLIRPEEISLESGIVLLLNRMAEALPFLPQEMGHDMPGRLETVIWINKTILACADALLVSAGKYHFSYRERGKRFADLAPTELAGIVTALPAMPELVARATEFKLRPSLALYPQDLACTWRQVAPVTDVVFRYLVQQEYGLSFKRYADFPGTYLGIISNGGSQGDSRLRRVGAMARQKALDLVRQLEQQHKPTSIVLKPFGAAQLVRALVPLMFQSYFMSAPTDELRTVHKYMRIIDGSTPEALAGDSQWCSLSRLLYRNWRAFCY